MVSAGYGDAASSVPGPHPPSSVGGFTPHSYGGGPTLPSSTFNVTAFQNSVRHRKITPASAPQSRGEYMYFKSRSCLSKYTYRHKERIQILLNIQSRSKCTLPRVITKVLLNSSNWLILVVRYYTGVRIAAPRPRQRRGSRTGWWGDGGGCSIWPGSRGTVRPGAHQYPVGDHGEGLRQNVHSGRGRLGGLPHRLHVPGFRNRQTRQKRALRILSGWPQGLTRRSRNSPAKQITNLRSLKPRQCIQEG